MLLRGYYAILDVAGPSDPTADVQALVTRAQRLLDGRPCMLQVRAKAWGGGALAALARAVHPAARAAGVPLCVNDRLDVALAVGAEAVHLGQDDLPLPDARRLAAGRLVIGISTHTLGQVQAAVAGGADYLGFGPIFPTGTKANPDPVVGVDGLGAAVHATAGATPVVAIGGIALERVADVAAAGASAAALIGAIEQSPDPGAAGRRVNATFGM